MTIVCLNNGIAGKFPKKLRETVRFLSNIFQVQNKFRGGLHETVFTKRPESYNPSCRNEQLNPRESI